MPAVDPKYHHLKLTRVRFEETIYLERCKPKRITVVARLLSIELLAYRVDLDVSMLL